MRIGRFVFQAVLLAAFVINAHSSPGREALAHFVGSDFQGGAKDLFGSTFDGEDVNYVYAQPTGEHATMQVTFTVKEVPPLPLFVHLKGRDDDAPAQCAIAIKLNGQVLFEGKNTFSARQFETKKFSIPEGLLKVGENTLVVCCQEQEGKAGMPPWFQVAACVIGPEQYVIQPDLHKDFYVKLPKELRAFPEPLPEGKEPGFKFRGTKGWMWTPQQYLAEIPYLKQFKMNFLMNCYAGMCDIEHYAWGSPQCNRWWEDLPAEKKAGYEQVVRECQKAGITFCFSMNPNIAATRVVNDNNPGSVDLLFKHFAWMQGLGVKWFNVSLDDITDGINGSTQAKVVNEIFHRLRAKDPEAQMIFCPTFYWGDGTEKKQKPYLEALASELDKDIYLFWTGDSVVGKITRKGADTFRSISGHRMFLWDNYPVNDNNPTMHLAPVIDRDPDICEVVDGYMSNPLCKQNEINRLPLATCADYAWNPNAYEPMRSIGQAILHQAETTSQRAVLKDLVEAYPGMLIYRKGTGFNAVREQFARIIAAPHSRQTALAYIEHIEALSSRLKSEFPSSYQPEKKTVDDDAQFLKQKFAAKYRD